jgi:cysteine desulfurase/selenocysteine lyase
VEDVIDTVKVKVRESFVVEHNGFDVTTVREDFPILLQKVHGHDLVYLDNAASAQKPRLVIDAIASFYKGYNANIHRGVHYLSELATQRYEDVRLQIKNFLNAESHREIIFTKGTTEAINLVASSFGRKFVKAGGEIIISTMEHHSNIVPWQLLCEATGAELRVIPINDDAEILFDEYKKLINPRTKLVSVGHISNSLGTINPVKEMIAYAHQHNVPVLLDGAQAVPHQAVDMRDLDCDFYAFSGHKVFGPTGVGVLYGKERYLQAMPPYQGGGDMIESVSFEKTTYAQLPNKLEAGTPNIAGVIGLGRALEYVSKIGYDAIHHHEAELLAYATESLESIDKVRIIGTAKEKASVISFVVEGIHPHDIGTVLDREGIAIRTGHHCAQPVMQRFNVPATSRASFAFYNTIEEVDKLVAALHKAIDILS